MSSTRNPRPWATSKDWNTHKDLVVHLYAGNSLAEVMSTMEREYGFRATTKMYKSHITQWRIDKKNKESEMIAMVHEFARRKRQGKASLFLLRGRFVDLEDLMRYWKRKSVAFQDVLLRESDPLDSEVVDCMTPMASPVMCPRTLDIPERVFISIRDYLRHVTTDTLRSFEACESRRILNFYISLKMHMLSERTIRACELFDHGTKSSACEAGKLLISATAQIKGILSLESPITLSDLFCLIIEVHRKGKYEVTFAILQQFMEMGNICLSQTHPLAVICALSTQLEPAHLHNVALEALRLLGDEFDNLLRVLHPWTMRLPLEDVEQTNFNKERRDLMLELLNANYPDRFGYAERENSNSQAFICLRMSQYLKPALIVEELSFESKHGEYLEKSDAIWQYRNNEFEPMPYGSIATTNLSRCHMAVSQQRI